MVSVEGAAAVAAVPATEASRDAAVRATRRGRRMQSYFFERGEGLLGSGTVGPARLAHITPNRGVQVRVRHISVTGRTQGVRRNGVETARMRLRPVLAAAAVLAAALALPAHA